MRPVLVFVVILGGCTAESQDDTRSFTHAGSIMGTRYSVKVANPPEGDAAANLRRAIEVRLEQINTLLSTYDLGSDVSQLNQSESVQWVDVSSETAEVIAEGILAGLQTEEAFDITCGPMVNLWGFGPDRRTPQRVPSNDEIAQAKALVGLEYLEFQLDPPAVRKSKPSLQIDLSGVAKGYAVDQLALLLRGSGIVNFLIDIGGELRAQGVNPDGRPWRIGIEVPAPGVRSLQRVVELIDTGLATSGDYRNYFEQDGRRYSHIIDPRSGRPIEHRLASVSVLDPSCARADALATGLMVLGPQDGFRVALEQKLAVLFIIHTDSGFIERMTSEFEAACLPRE